MKSLLVLVALVFCNLSIARASAISEDWLVAWNEDLEFFETTLPENHPALFHSLPEDEFRSAIGTLRARLAELSHHEIIVELAAIVASVNDGHTRLTLPMIEGAELTIGHSSTPTPKDTAMLFNHYPIRLYIYDDGLYVRRIGADKAAYAGSKVIRIGQMSAQEALDAVSKVVQRDNEFQLKHLAPSFLVIPEVLGALHISRGSDQAAYVLETADGEQHKVTLTPVAPGTSVAWVDAGDQSGRQALYLRNQSANFWFEHLEDQRTVYWQYNEVYDTPDESIAAFARRLTDYIAEHQLERLIIDLRFNYGGDNTLNRSLMHALIRAPALRDPGSLFVIAGRGTFSAAMMFALDLEKQTNAIFVGEPTGARPNHYGDSRKLRLPNSGVTIRVSSLFWQYGGPNDDRLALAPHIPAALSSQDYRSGIDPALQAILALSADQPSDHVPGGNWTGRILDYNTVVHLDELSSGWAGDIDFVDLGASDLPLTDVTYNASTLNFNFPNGDQVISFEGKLLGNIILGRVVSRGQTYPWVALRQ